MTIQRVARQYIKPDRLSIVHRRQRAGFRLAAAGVGFSDFEVIPIRPTRSDVGDAQEWSRAGIGQPGRPRPSVDAARSMRIMISCGEASGDL
jgi:hypothetical protein